MLERYESLISQYRSAWRFRRVGIVVAWSIGVAGWLAVCLIPSQYETAARVYVDTNTLLRPLLEGITVSQNTGSQVDLVRRALLSRPQLEHVIDTTELKDRVKSERSRETTIQDLSKAIQIKVDMPNATTREANTFQIIYADSDPDLAFQVVDAVLKSFVSQSVGEARVDADVAQQFLQSQIAQYEKRLTAAESRLAAFKKRNIGSMPDDRGGYFQRLQTEMSTVEQLRSSLNVAVRKRDELRGKLLGGGTTSVMDSAAVETSVDGRIRDSRAKLEDMLLRYTDEHPDVIALHETIERLEGQRRAEIEALRSNAGALGAPRASSSLVAQNLQIALNQAEVDVTTLQSQLADHGRQVGELRARVNTVPEVEAELARLNRDYDVTKTEYERLLQRLESAKLSDAADRIDEVKFRVLDPPVKALIPTKPHRALLMLGVLAAALGGGLGLTWLLSQIRPVVVHPRDLGRFKDVPVFGVVSAALDGAVAVADQRELRAVSMAVAGLVIGTGLLVVLYPFLEGVVRALFWAGGG